MEENNKHRCEMCGKEYTSQNSLNAHKRTKHGLVKRNTCMHFDCPVCGNKIDVGHFGRHLTKEHGYSKDSKEFFVYTMTYTNYFVKHIEDKGLLKDFFSRMYDRYGSTPQPWKMFATYYNMITKIREYETERDNINFIENVLEWKKEHPTLANSVKFCELTFNGEPENARKYYEENLLAKNPFKGHDKSLSPFSKDFIGYKNLSDEEKEHRVKVATKHQYIGRNPNQVEYWLKHGLTREESLKMVHNRQQTFSLEKCIERYGYEEGTRRWKERQEKWQNTLKSKPYEEQLRILKAKTENSKVTKPYSRIEHEFSSQLVSDEYKNVYVVPYAIPDICVGYKIIDFFGDYYHCNPKIYKPDFYNHNVGKYAHEIWESDRVRNERLEKDGYQVKIVWESDYKADKQKVIDECKEFLGDM